MYGITDEEFVKQNRTDLYTTFLGAQILNRTNVPIYVMHTCYATTYTVDAGYKNIGL